MKHGNQFKDLEVYKSRITEPQTSKNPFLWLIPVIFIVCVYNVYTGYSDYTLSQSVRGISVEIIQRNQDRFKLPEVLENKVQSISSEEEYRQAFKEYSQQLKFRIGIYLATFIIAVGLLWKDIIAIFGTAVFLVIASGYTLFTASLGAAMIDFTIFVILLFFVLKMEE